MSRSNLHVNVKDIMIALSYYQTTFAMYKVLELRDGKWDKSSHHLELVSKMLCEAIASVCKIERKIAHINDRKLFLEVLT